MLKPLNIILSILLSILIVGGCCLAAQAQQTPDQKSVKSSLESDADKDFFAELNAPDNSETGKDNEPSMAVTIVSFIGKLILVLAIAYGCIFGLKKLNGIKAGVIDGNKRVVVLEHTSLAPGRQLHLVNVGGKSLLIGSTAQQISILAELDPNEIPDIKESEPVGFKDQLSQFLGHNPKKTEAARSVAEMLRESTSQLRGTVAEVNKLRGNLRSSEDE